MSININVFVSSFIDENTYIITDSESREAAVVDPGVLSSDIRALLEAYNLKYILLTHGHGDHIKAIDEYLEAYPSSKVVAHCQEVEFLADAELNGTSHMLSSPIEVKVDCPVEEGDVLKLGSSNIEFIHTPGHTPGGQCIIIDKTMFSGDTLFFMSVGATHFPLGDWDALKASIQNKLFVLDDDITVLPGHGPNTSIGYEKRANPFV